MIGSSSEEEIFKFFLIFIYSLFYIQKQDIYLDSPKLSVMPDLIRHDGKINFLNTPDIAEKLHFVP
jgi:hypothetical protein